MWPLRELYVILMWALYNKPEMVWLSPNYEYALELYNQNLWQFQLSNHMYSPYKATSNQNIALDMLIYGH